MSTDLSMSKLSWIRLRLRCLVSGDLIHPCSGPARTNAKAGIFGCHNR